MNVSLPWRPRASCRPGAALAALLALGGLLAPGARAQYPAAPTLNPAYAFAALNNDGTSADGTQPQAGLIALGDGYLYGTASAGGASGSGTVFKVHPDGTGFTVIHDFSGTDGSAPVAALVAPGDGYLYGTTQFGGANNIGVVFRLFPNEQTDTTYGYQDLHDFAILDGNGFNAEGSNPVSALISFDGSLVGTASGGGANGDGTVFEISPDGTTFTDLHDFDYADGATPDAALLAPGDGFLYGTTSIGGDNGTGTLFRWGQPSTLTTLYSFSATDPSTGDNADGANPNAPLIAPGDGFLYGTAAGGGTNDEGTVFRFSTDGTAVGTTFSTLYSFSAAAGNTDGSAPRAALVTAGDGLLYGTTTGGGANSSGTVFRLSPDGTTTPLQTYYTLNPATNDGSNSTASLLVFGDGFLYGTAAQGGALGSGTVFQLTGPPVSHVLWNNPDGRTIFWDVNSSGSPVVAGNYQAFNDDASGNTAYKAIALSTGPDGVSHLLWTNPDGHAYLWTVQADGSHNDAAHPDKFYGPFSDDGTANTIWQPVAVSTGGDNVTHVLWSNPDGRTILWDVASDNSFNVVGNYGPQLDGAGGPRFVPVALASDLDGLSHVLWTNPDGRTLLWNLDAGDNPTSYPYGPFSDDHTSAATEAATLWSARSLSVGPDGVPHLLWNNPNAHTILWDVASDGTFTIAGNYGAYSDSALPNTAYTAVSLATGLDNRSRFAWDNPDGNTYFWNVDSAADAPGAGTSTSTFYGPFSDDGTANTIWKAVAVSAAVPALTPL